MPFGQSPSPVQRRRPTAVSCYSKRESAKEERTVAVLGFADKGPSVELAPLRIALAEMLTGDLSQLEGIRAVERVRVSAVFWRDGLPANRR